MSTKCVHENGFDGSNYFVESYEIYDDRYGYPGKFQLLKCQHCGHKMLQGEFSEDVLGKLYTKYYPRATFELKSYKVPEEESGFCAWLDGKYSSAFRWVPKNVRVLDIGCGFGESLGYYESRGCEAYGVEVDENVKGVAEKYGYNIHMGSFDPNLYEDDFFDYVTLSQVIEHATDPVVMLRGVSKVLKPGGRAILSTPNSNGWEARVFGRKWINWHAPYHLHHFSVKSMTTVVEKAGLRVEKVRTITSSEWLFYQWVHLLTFPEMGKPSLFWSPTSVLGIKEKVLFKLMRAIHLTKINHVITRFLDHLSLGDNFVFILRKPVQDV